MTDSPDPQKRPTRQQAVEAWALFAFIIMLGGVVGGTILNVIVLGLRG